MADKKVVVYSTPSCPWCRIAKENLAPRGVQFTDYNVAEDSAKLQEMIRQTGQRGVPVIVIDGTVIVGFNQAKIDEALSDQ